MMAAYKVGDSPRLQTKEWGFRPRLREMTAQGPGGRM